MVPDQSQESNGFLPRKRGIMKEVIEFAVWYNSLGGDIASIRQNTDKYLTILTDYQDEYITPYPRQASPSDDRTRSLRALSNDRGEQDNNKGFSVNKIRLRLKWPRQIARLWKNKSTRN